MFFLKFLSYLYTRRETNVKKNFEQDLIVNFYLSNRIQVIIHAEKKIAEKYQIHKYKRS